MASVNVVAVEQGEQDGNGVEEIVDVVSEDMIVEDAEVETDEISLKVKWGNVLIPIEINEGSTISELKMRLWSLTEVLPARQKLIGLSKKSASSLNDDTLLKSLGMKQEQKIMLVGSLESDIQSVMNISASELASDVFDDLDVDYSDSKALQETLHKANLKKLERRIEQIDIRIMNPFRNGKRLLVLDLDYTLFDCKSAASSVSELARPGLHEFLSSVYPFYDIAIWSQTSWRWLEAKITSLGMIFHPNYKLAFTLDATSMFSVSVQKNNERTTHSVKALEIIWRKFPDRFDSRNTIHIDDLGRNFALNPQSGLKISAFKNAPITYDLVV